MLSREELTKECIEAKKDFDEAYNLFLEIVELNSAQLHMLDYVIDTAIKHAILENDLVSHPQFAPSFDENYLKSG